MGSASGRSRSVTFHPLSRSSQATNAPTASGRDFSTAALDSPDWPLARRGHNLAPPINGRVVRREQQQDLGLQGVGVLKLVDEDVRQPALQRLPQIAPVADEVASLEEQIDEIQDAGPRFELLAPIQALEQLHLKERGEIGVAGQPRLAA